MSPVSDEYPAFSGVIRYTKIITLDKAPKIAYLKAEQVYELMTVWVNGKEAGYRIGSPYQIDLFEYLNAGENDIVIEVTNTFTRDHEFT